MNTEKISKETISTYAAHKEEEEFVIDYLSSLVVYEYDDYAIMLKSSLQCFDEKGSLYDSWHTTRRAQGDYFIYERYNHRGELEGCVVYDKDGREIESTMLGNHKMTYDTDGKLLSQKGSYNNDDTYEYYYSYDTSGKLIQTIEKQNGQSRILKHYYSEDVVGNVVETSLDSEGNLIRTEVKDKSTGYIIESKQVCDSDSISYDVTYYRDYLNNTFHARISNNLVIQNSYRSLEYDEHNNWILELVKNNVHGDPQFYIRVRDIVYHDENGANEF